MLFMSLPKCYSIDHKVDNSSSNSPEVYGPCRILLFQLRIFFLHFLQTVIILLGMRAVMKLHIRRRWLYIDAIFFCIYVHCVRPSRTSPFTSQ